MDWAQNGHGRIHPKDPEQRFPPPATPSVSRAPCTDAKSDSEDQNRISMKVHLTTAYGDGMAEKESSTFAALSISAYVLPSYSKIGSQPTTKTNENDHISRICSQPAIRRVCYQTSPAPLPAQSFPTSSPEKSRVPVPGPGRKQTCRPLRRICRHRRPGDC